MCKEHSVLSYTSNYLINIIKVTQDRAQSQSKEKDMGNGHEAWQIYCIQRSNKDELQQMYRLEWSAEKVLELLARNITFSFNEVKNTNMYSLLYLIRETGQETHIITNNMIK